VIDLGVYRGGVDVTMPEHMCDLGERGAFPEHLRRRGVPQQVSTAGSDSASS
jgi:hypothetical protein